ncbi:glycoside hydrolase family 10 protein [Sphingobacterium bovistauri]|uniref:Family 10 glycosylhydrolase n=1 Tax=Sphingobacterium bovistauri TaxID=2781959 RepID=A0ABS7Z689_9SPHI|nr:family 10 glycosylhydrolase [Sphingobacterium bovistauri]MCA5005706.1 family 10 glycosylhydrolase [Sphingobacterium bovistauri]
MKVKIFNVLALMSLFLLFAVSCKSKKQKEKSKPLVEAAVSNTAAIQSQAITPAPKAEVNSAVKEKVEALKEEKVKVTLPEVPREFRAAWVATVANINWPSKRDLTTEQQKEEAIRLLDLLKDNNFNAVIFQVRPSSDALYDSKFEPWSYFLTGEIGKRPEPFYDPLEFWVEEAHKRGLELHVWLNPYRAHHSNGGVVTSKSMARTASDYVVRLKNGMYWFDPADQRTQDHASRVVNDIVKRYDIDGVHFDDYFYPYASYNGGSDFPDNKTWNIYKSNGGELNRGDWRRSHVNNFIERIYKEIKAEKPFVKFGLSPFGIWKPGYPAGVTGSSQYDELYADAKLWLNKGWIDYFTPQLYWPIEPSRQSFTALLKWWESENTFGRHLWPGLNTVEVKASHKPSEIVNQINATRSIVPNSPGVVHWSIAGLTKSPEMLSTIANGPYRIKSLVPKSPWLKANSLLAPTLLITAEQGKVFAKWLHQQPEQVRQYVVYAKYGDSWEWEILNSEVSSKEFVNSKNGKKLNSIAVKAIDRLGNESDYEAKIIK